MTTKQIIKISSLIKKTKSDSYRIVESITSGKKIDKFHQWANGRYYHGAFLIANKYDESYWFLLIEWKPKTFYLVLYPENRSGPIIEAKDFKIVDGSEKLLWYYIPRKQDGKNPKRLANFIKFYTSRTAEISIPNNNNDILDFYDEVFWLLEIKAKSEALIDVAAGSEYIFPEGKKRQRIHITRERNRKLVELAKKEFKRKNKRVFCEICKFDFEKKYGKIGEDFIEAHHTLPLSLITEKEVKTKITDLVMVCSNCHRIIHRKRPWLSKDKLILLLSK